MFGIFVAFRGRNVRQLPGMTSLSLAAVSSDNPVSGDEHIRLARASGRFGIGRVAQPKRIQRRSSTPRAATDLGNPRPQTMYGQKISFVGRFGLQATFISFVTISIVLTLAKSGLPGEGRGHSDQNRHTVLPATLRRWQKRRGSRETASNAALRQNAFIMGVELIHTLNTIY